MTTAWRCLPNCMMTDSAEPCIVYQKLRAERDLLLERMQAIFEAIEDNDVFQAGRIARAALAEEVAERYAASLARDVQRYRLLRDGWIEGHVKDHRWGIFHGDPEKLDKYLDTALDALASPEKGK